MVITNKYTVQGEQLVALRIGLTLAAPGDMLEDLPDRLEGTQVPMLLNNKCHLNLFLL